MSKPISDELFDRIRGSARKFKKRIAVLPAYNAATTLEATIRDIPQNSVDEIILVDDCSRDNTSEIGRKLGLTVIRHEKNRGYGGNQKTCYDTARKHGADVVVMLHPDYQYDARLVPHFIGFLETGVCDLMMGSRIRSRAETLRSGMPPYKYLSNRGLTIFENFFLGQNLGDFHSGFRIYTREVLDTIPYHRNSEDFVFDSQFLAQSAYFGFKIGDAPMPCRYFDEASSINFSRSTRYGLETVRTVGSFTLAKWGLHKSKLFRPVVEEDRLALNRDAINRTAQVAEAQKV